MVSAKYLIADDGGYIAGWKIDKTKFVSPSNQMEIDSNGSMKGPQWSITNTGVATFEDIHANKEGEIAGWKISSTALSGPGGALTLASGGTNGYGIFGKDFKLNASGLTFTSGGATINAGGNTLLTEGNTRIKNAQGEKELPTYINDLIVNNAEIKKLLTYQGIDTSWIISYKAVQTGTQAVPVVNNTVQVPVLENQTFIYLGVAPNNPIGD